MKTMLLVGFAMLVGCTALEPNPCPGQVVCPGADTCCPEGDTCSADGTECFPPAPPQVGEAEACLNAGEEPCPNALTGGVDCAPAGSTCCLDGYHCPAGTTCSSTGTECLTIDGRARR